LVLEEGTPLPPGFGYRGTPAQLPTAIVGIGRRGDLG
jgi:hypothetical protein